MSNWKGPDSDEMVEFLLNLAAVAYILGFLVAVEAVLLKLIY
jgi:hypothetical protein